MPTSPTPAEAPSPRRCNPHAADPAAETGACTQHRAPSTEHRAPRPSSFTLDALSGHAAPMAEITRYAPSPRYTE
ncbi:hypothetical protein ACFQ51_08440 [Streptomyces kaempferi]